MARKFKEVEPSSLEKLMKECFAQVGLEIEDNKASLLLRLIISSIGCYFFQYPDDVVNIGFLKIWKSPRKEELFNIEIIYNAEEGIVNARELNRFYKGSKLKGKELRKLIDSFMEELISYSQAQEMEATKTVSKISREVQSK